jgi:ATP-dependent DNA helicase RecG
VLGLRKFVKPNETPEPEFQEYSGGFAVIFRFKEVMNTAPTSIAISKPPLSKRQEQILKILSDGNPISTVEIAKRLRISQRTVQVNLATLNENGLIERIGQSRVTLWKMRV